ncbi:hypothetical protein F5050DRAFT_1552066, partial [Lentinula boryana]
HNLSIEPTPLTLSRYIAHTSQFIASAPKYLTGAQHFLKSIYPDFGSNRNSALVQATINGSRKLRADPVKRKLPIRPSHLLIFEQRYYGNPSYDNLLFLVTISCMFYGCHRSGELVVKGSRSTINYRKIIKRSSLHFENGHAGYRLPYHKADRFYRGTDILLSRQQIADPIFLLGLYRTCRDNIHGPRAELFLRKDGSLPTRSWFDKHFFSVLSRDYGGHSVRAGAATWFARIGISEGVIQ